MEDKTLVCKDCGVEFIFSAAEQEFYAEKAFRMNLPAALPAVGPESRLPTKTAASVSTTQ